MSRKRKKRKQTNYEAGRYYEYKERDRLRAEGWWAERQYGSYGVFDVLATNGTVTLFVEIKSSKKKVTQATVRAAIKRLKTIPKTEALGAKGPTVRRLLVTYSGRPAIRREIEV